MNDTAIKWTEKTWNPASGCVPASEGCKYCYARSLAEQKRGTAAFPRGFDLTVRRHKLREPFAIKEPALIFVNSMSDLFWSEYPDDLRREAIEVMRATPRHTYQVLTKRPGRAVDFFEQVEAPPNLWLGATVESQRWTKRLDALRAAKVAHRFVSAEPLLTPLTLDLAGIEWVIVGGESGLHLRDAVVRGERGLSEPTARGWSPRSDRVDWVRDLRDQCGRSNVPFFFKQWGGVLPHSAGDLLDGVVHHEYPTAMRTAA